MYPSSSISRLVIKLLLLVGLAVATSAGIIGLFLANPAITVAIVGGFFLVLGLSLSGNPRLFCLWGLFLSAPINLDIGFLAIPHMGGAGAYTIDLVDFFLAPLVLFILRDFYRGYRHKLRLSHATTFWGILILLGLIAMVVGPLRHVVAHEIFRMLKLLLLFIVIINEVVRLKQFKHVFLALMAGLTIQCLIGLVQYAFDLNLGAQILGEAKQEIVEYTSKATYMEHDFTYRIGALFGHPNLLSVYLVLMLPLGIGMLFTKTNPLLKFALTIIVVLGLTVLVLTLSRSGWISFAFAFVTLLVITFIHPAARTRFLFGRVAMIASIGVMGLIMAGPILKRILQSDPGAVSFRWEWMEVSMEMIKAKPFLGFGLNTFVFNMAPYSQFGTVTAIVDYFGPNLPVVHNIYLLVWSEQGTIGLLAFLAFYGYILMLGWRNTRYFDSDLLYMINAGCVAGLMGLALDGMASFFIRNDAPGRVFIIIAALIVAIHYWHRDNSRPLAN